MSDVKLLLGNPFYVDSAFLAEYPQALEDAAAYEHEYWWRRDLILTGKKGKPNPCKELDQLNIVRHQDLYKSNSYKHTQELFFRQYEPYVKWVEQHKPSGLRAVSCPEHSYIEICSSTVKGEVYEYVCQRID